MLLSLLLMTVAIARPRKALVNELVKGEGIDITLAMDISSSMLTTDFTPNRLEVSKTLAREFVQKRIQDRIALVVFAGESFTQCPLTTDHEILSDFIMSQNVGYLEDGTAIGMGLATAVNRMRDSKAKSKVIILLTDGVNNKGYIEPMTAAALAKEMDIKVYCIGLGSGEFALGPVDKDAGGNYIMGYLKGEMDEDLLRKIATTTGGNYFRARNTNDLRAVYQQIDKLEKSEVDIEVLKKYKEWFRGPAIASLLLYLLGLILHTTLFKKLP
ncbi:MAG: VWA domain-containing protein [Saprospiraceae bacterium]|nr:VWA domain-containing protein [Saprospiraceae bacterium]